MSKTHQTGPLVARFDRNPLGRDLIVGDLVDAHTLRPAEPPSALRW